MILIYVYDKTSIKLTIYVILYTPQQLLNLFNLFCFCCFFLYRTIACLNNDYQNLFIFYWITVLFVFSCLVVSIYTFSFFLEIASENLISSCHAKNCSCVSQLKHNCALFRTLIKIRNFNVTWKVILKNIELFCHLVDLLNR